MDLADLYDPAPIGWVPFASDWRPTSPKVPTPAALGHHTLWLSTLDADGVRT